MEKLKAQLTKIANWIKSLDIGTIIRSVALGVALINQILAITGKNILPFVENDVYQIGTLSFTFIMSLISAWENNDFTWAAKLGTKILNALQDNKITKEEIENILNQKDTEDKDLDNK